MFLNTAWHVPVRRNESLSMIRTHTHPLLLDVCKLRMWHTKDKIAIQCRLSNLTREHSWTNSIWSRHLRDFHSYANITHPHPCDNVSRRPRSSFCYTHHSFTNNPQQKRSTISEWRAGSPTPFPESIDSALSYSCSAGTGCCIPSLISVVLMLSLLCQVRPRSHASLKREFWRH